MHITLPISLHYKLMWAREQTGVCAQIVMYVRMLFASVLNLGHTHTHNMMKHTCMAKLVRNRLQHQEGSQVDLGVRGVNVYLSIVAEGVP